MLEPIKKILPQSLLKKIRPLGHGFLALSAALYYGFPSKHITVIGVTGTAGKSTTIQMLAHILNSCGKKCGYITTVGNFDGNKEHMNSVGISMPSGPTIQRGLRHMLANGCKYAIVEATSEGLAQNRHLGTAFSLALFTNLAPAHIQAHGSFKSYMHAKGRLFAGAKAVGVNLGDPNSGYFLSFPAASKFGVRLAADNGTLGVREIYLASQPVLRGAGGNFVLRGVAFSLQLPGEFNARNALLAAAAADYLGVNLAQGAQALANFMEISGRMQQIKNELSISIFLDYAPEPLGMQNALETVRSLSGIGQLIHVFGSTGGHRDASKRFEFGAISARYADTIIITNDDVYDSDPEEIAKNVFEGIDRATQKKVKNILTILDRKTAIAKALQIAGPGDVVLITGKGSEQFLVLPGNKRIAWDEKAEIEKILAVMPKRTLKQ